MSPTVRSGLVQRSCPGDDASAPVVPIHQATLDKHLPSAGKVTAGVRSFGRQGIVDGPHSARGRS